MVNKIWGLLIVIGIIFCLFTGNIDTVNTQILESTKTALDMTLKILPVMALWLGIMKIAEVSNLLKLMAQKLSRVLKYIFPEIPKNHEAFSYISSNIIANMFGLGNAATPFGLKAMESLQTLNEDKEVASRSMITFLVLNTSGMTIIPTTMLSLRMLYSSQAPTAIVVPCIIVSFLSTFAGLLFDRFLGRRK